MFIVYKDAEQAILGNERVKWFILSQKSAIGYSI